MLGLRSLTNRIFLASTVLAAVSIGGAVYLVSARLTSEAESDVQRDLQEAATLLDEQRASLAATVTRTARLVADLPKFKAASDARCSSRRVAASCRSRWTSASASEVSRALTRYTAPPIETAASTVLARKMRLVSERRPSIGPGRL